MNTRFLSMAATAALFLLPLTGRAAPTVDTDSAANSAYTAPAGASTGYDGKGGSVPGFGAFHVTSVAAGGTFIFTAAEGEGNTGTPKPSSIDSGGRSFGLFSDGGLGAAVTIRRTFNTTEAGAGISAVGDSFALDFVTGYNDGGDTGLSGVSLLQGTTPVGMFAYHGNDFYTFNGAKVGPGYTSGALHLVYTLTSATTYSLAVTGALTYNGTGTFASPVTGFEVQQVNSANGDPKKVDPAHNGYFNNLSLTANAAP